MSAAREHPGSYYAATRHPVTFPPLNGEHRADVAVVGGGFTGVSAALHLAERGYDVVLIEANRIAWGASGRNGGQLIDGFVETSKIGKRFGADAEQMAWIMGLECRDIVVQRVRDYGIDCDLQFGYIDLALKQHDVDEFERTLSMKRARNYPHDVSLVAREDLYQYVGSDRYIGGLFNTGNGHLHPLNLCLGEAQAAASLGARIFEQSVATRINHGECPEVVTENGLVRASKVILAGNAYLGDTEPRIRNSVIPAGSYIIATERLNEAVAAKLLPQDSACCDQRAALDYFRLSRDRRLLFGGLCNYSGRRPKDISATLRPKLLQVFPGLADAHIEFEWGGQIAISVNRIPQFGRIKYNTYYAQGYSGHGLAPTHLAGKMLADVVAGDAEQFDVFAKVRHLNVPGGRRFANPLLAFGMLYYRLRELL